MALESNDEPQKPLSRSEQKRGEVSKEEEANLDAYRDFINTLDVLDEFGKD